MKSNIFYKKTISFLTGLWAQGSSKFIHKYQISTQCIILISDSIIIQVRLLLKRVFESPWWTFLLLLDRVCSSNNLYISIPDRCISQAGKLSWIYGGRLFNNSEFFDKRFFATFFARVRFVICINSASTDTYYSSIPVAIEQKLVNPQYNNLIQFSILILMILPVFLSQWMNERSKPVKKS